MHDTYGPVLIYPSPEITSVAQKICVRESINPNIECLGEVELLQTSNVLARHKTDLTLNRYTDFLAIEWDQIFA